MTTSPPPFPGVRTDDRTPPFDVPHTVLIDETDNDSTGYRVAGTPETLRWTPLWWAAEVADLFEAQRLADPRGVAL